MGSVEKDQMLADDISITIIDYRGAKCSYPVTAIKKHINGSAFVAFYDLAAVAADNEMQPLDWAVSTLLQTPIRRYSAFESLWKDNKDIWVACNRALEQLGPDRPLEDVDSELLRGQVQATFRAFMAPPGIGPSIAAKTLHKKRPQLIPVIDNFVATVLSGRPGVTLDAASMTSIIFNDFRPQLLSNLYALRETSQQLLADGLSLSLIRIFDIAIWMCADKKRSEYGLPQPPIAPGRTTP